MANLTQIELPNGTTYNIEDTDGRKEENLVWGGPSQTGDVSPVGMALSCEHSSNRLAFINGNALTFEYSSNAGSTWTDYGYSATNKSAFCTQEYSVPVGRPNSSTEYTTSSRTRITLTAQNGTTGYVYTKPRKILINVSTSGGMQVLVEVRTGTNYQSSGAWSTLGTYNLSGWSGWNDIPLVISTLGGGKTQTGNYWQLRLTFIMTSIHATNKTNANILSLRLFGSTAWTTPTGQLSKTGHIYSFDMSQNSTFPANLKMNADKQVAYMTAMPTTGKVVVTDGTTGGIKASGYTPTGVWVGTQAEYDAIATPDPNVTYYITDSSVSPTPTAATIYYDSYLSGLNANTVQSAIDNVSEIINVSPCFTPISGLRIEAVLVNHTIDIRIYGSKSTLTNGEKLADINNLAYVPVLGTAIININNGDTYMPLSGRVIIDSRNRDLRYHGNNAGSFSSIIASGMYMIQTPRGGN